MKILISLLFIAHVANSSVNEVDVVTNGAPIHHTDDKQVTVTNNYDFSLSVFWGFNATKEVHLFEIDPSESVEFSTHNGHSFFATDAEDHTKVLQAFSVNAGMYNYTIKPKAVLPLTQRTSQVTPIGRTTTSLTAKFRCLATAADYWFEDGLGGAYQGTLTLGMEASTNSFEGHVFFFTEKGNKSNEYARLILARGQPLYIVLDKNNPPPASYLEHAAAEEKFRDEYLKRTGLIWRHFHGPDGPRAKPFLHMWPAPAIGHKHIIKSSHGFWNCAGTSATCHHDQPLEMELEVVSMTPKVFIIPLFLSDFECDEIINLARPIISDSLVGVRGTAGAGLRSTRTSKNSWIKRETNAVTETLSMRAADLMKIDEKLLRSDLNSEELQVVHYDKTQKYDAHNDWTGANRPESRFLTLLIYLNDPDAGGETSFPKGADGLGFKVTPRKGSAVLFYNLLEDGNGDDLALHSAMPVLSGEKWAANYWVWDPKR